MGVRRDIAAAAVGADQRRRVVLGHELPIDDRQRQVRRRELEHAVIIGATRRDDRGDPTNPTNLINSL